MVSTHQVSVLVWVGCGCRAMWGFLPSCGSLLMRAGPPRVEQQGQIVPLALLQVILSWRGLAWRRN